MLETPNTIAKHATKIKNIETREAFWYLVGLGTTSQKLTCKATGSIEKKNKLDFQFRINNNYILAFIVNQAHLLFYLRKKTVLFSFEQIQLDLKEQFEIKINSSEELTIKVKNLEQAQIVARELLFKYF